MDEEVITQATMGSVDSSIPVVAEEKKDNSLSADSLLLDKEKTIALGFLKPFCFWLVVAIGGLAGLACITVVLIHASNYIKKR
jgi:hypothetical protein